MDCNCWTHAKCLNLSRVAFQYFLDNPQVNWTCSWCSLPKLNLLDGREDDSCFASEAVEEEILLEAGSVDIEDSLTWFHSNVGNYYKSNLKIAYLNIKQCDQQSR